jgi:hypothetical protein
MSKNKIAYFQGGGYGNEPTPGKKKYKSDPAIVVQPRFKEPFYRNYDLYKIPGMEEIGPSAGWHDLQNYESVQQFLEASRKRLQPRYVADDSWQIDDGSRVKKNPTRQARLSIIERIVKVAQEIKVSKRSCQDSDIVYTDSRDAYICGNCLHMGGNCLGIPKPTAKQLHAGENHNSDRIDWRDGSDRENDPNYQRWKRNVAHTDENDGANFDYGDGAYTAMSEGKKMETITEAPHKSPGAFSADDEDVNHIDFPIDDMINRQDQMIYPEEDEYNIRRLKGDKYQFPSDGSPLDPGNLNISLTTPQISGEHTYLPDPDFEGKTDNGSQLNFGRDYTEEDLPGRQFDFMDADDKEMDLNDLESKYLESSETGLFGLPDGVDPEGHDADQTKQIEQPYDTISDISNEMYEDKWNI